MIRNLVLSSASVNSENMRSKVECDQNKDTINLESSALNGLRAFAAIHILIHHSLARSTEVRIYGSVSVILFLFVLF